MDNSSDRMPAESFGSFARCASKGVDAVGPPKLNRLLFLPFEGKNAVLNVKLQDSGASIEAIATLSDGTTRNRTLNDNGACTALQRPVGTDVQYWYRFAEKAPSQT